MGEVLEVEKELGTWGHRCLQHGAKGTQQQNKPTKPSAPYIKNVIVNSRSTGFAGPILYIIYIICIIYIIEYIIDDI